MFALQAMLAVAGCFIAFQTAHGVRWYFPAIGAAIAFPIAVLLVGRWQAETLAEIAGGLMIYAYGGYLIGLGLNWLDDRQRRQHPERYRRRP